MESSLRPRDIQARIRAGESLDDVARVAGVPPERIEAFAAPVIAERDHVAGLAQTHPVRRRGETSSNRALRAAVGAQLAQRSIDPASVTWDSWRVADRRWLVRASYGDETAPSIADFHYDQSGRFTTAVNDEARWLIGDEGPKAQPVARPSAPDDEPLHTDDELAIVRAIQSATEVDPDEPTQWIRRDDGDTSDADDAWSEPELAEVDGVYELVPAATSDLDVLYDMLSSFDEDSVKIYSGLIHPAEAAPASEDVVLAAAPDEPHQPTLDEAGLDEPVEVAESVADEVLITEVVVTELVVTEVRSDEVTEPEQPALDDEPGAEAEPDTEPEPDSQSESAAEAGVVEPEAPVTDAESAAAASEEAPVLEPEQPSLVEGEPPAKPKRPAKKRAAVPSWDEIMFGAPRPEA